MEIFIENNKVKFTQGVQTFTIDYEGDDDELKWMAEQLDTCFKNFMHEIKMETIAEYNQKMITELTRKKTSIHPLCPVCFRRIFDEKTCKCGFIIGSDILKYACPDCNSKRITHISDSEHSCQKCGYLWQTGR